METIVDLANFIKSNNSHTLLEMQSMLKKRLGAGFKVNKLDHDSEYEGRLCISFSSQEPGTSEVKKYANGLVFEYPSGKVLSIPNQRITSFPSKTQISDNFLFYDIINGSTVTLYWYGGWRISTTNGIDMGGVSWIGNKTYGCLLYEIAEKCGIKNIYNDSRLDRNCSYTCILYAREYHLISQLPDKLYFISAHNCASVNNGNTVVNLPIPAGLPMQIPREFKMRKGGMNKTEYVNMQIRSSTKMFLRNGSLNLGYIIRSGNNGDCYMLESDLMRVIKRMTHEMPRDRDMRVNADNRLLYIALRAFLNPLYKDLYLKLNPSAGELYIKFASFVNSLLSKILLILMQNSLPKIIYDETPLSMDMIALEISHKMTECGASSNKSIDIIKDSLLSPDKLPIYFKYLSAHENN